MKEILYLAPFFKKYPQNLKYTVKQACNLFIIGTAFCKFNFVWYISSNLILSFKNRGWVRSLELNRQNLLSVMKIIC